jgi:hypothetical protein
MKEEQTEEDAINQQFTNYLTLSIVAVIVLAIVFLLLNISIGEILGINSVSGDVESKNANKSRLMAALFFIAYVVTTYFAVDTLMKEYEIKIATIKEMKEQTSKKS